jgi:hypothetical protein
MDGVEEHIEEHVAESDEQPSREEREVLRWRFRQIRSLGVNAVEARLLAETGADLGLLRRLVGNGCPPELAVKIAL